MSNKAHPKKGLVFDDAYYVGITTDCPRMGEKGFIQRVVFGTEPRVRSTLCYVVQYDDGFVFFAPVEERYAYMIVPADATVNIEREMAMRSMLEG